MYNIILNVSFIIICILFAGQEMIFRRNYKQRKNNNHIPKKIHDTIPINTIAIVSLNFVFFLGVPLNYFFDFLPKLVYWDPSYLWLVLGGCISLIGVVMRFVSVLTLAEAHSTRIHTQEKQILHQDGLYKYIRHPIYLGLLLNVAGISLMFQDAFMLSIGVGVYLLVVLIRFKSEEKTLIRHFGEDYLTYIKKTKAIIPFIY